MHSILVKFFVFLFCFLSTNLYAISNRNSLGNFCVEAEWIYFQPFVDSSIIHAQPRVILNRPGHQSGWRVGAGYQFCNCLNALFFRWTQFNASNTEHFSAFVATVPIFETGENGDGSERLNFRHHSFDALVSQNLYCGNCFHFDLLGGIQYARTRTRQNAQFTAEGNTITGIQRSRFWGVGPELGVDAQFRFWGCLSLGGKALASLLASRTRHREISTTTDDGGLRAEARIDPKWRLIPSANARIFLKLDLQFNCLCFFVEGGYEAITYLGALPMINLLGSEASNYSRLYSNVSMHGPYISGGISY